ncbi:Hypothetical protein SRAE_0000028500 [Strongyloides ratti]|uniref:Uncharacterized protein n=1 Tax=Strongyloides ratti TaxID=34506 RepID=A0A090KZ57_STRRB|nr:Hypothetical protein SRAE_0000028500 [Strongyloides ratti]CEF61157.1 Hypothetical protein SRAE_0000028500 [Strongyloides ratti]
MHFIRNNQIIVSFLIIFLSVIQFGESIPSNYKIENIKDLQKRAVAVQLAERLNNENQNNARDYVTKYYKSPSDPNSFGRK